MKLWENSQLTFTNNIIKFDFTGRKYSLSYWRSTRPTVKKMLHAPKTFADIFPPNFWYKLILTKYIQPSFTKIVEAKIEKYQGHLNSTVTFFKYFLWFSLFHKTSCKPKLLREFQQNKYPQCLLNQSMFVTLCRRANTAVFTLN